MSEFELQMRISVDGDAAAPNGEEHWQFNELPDSSGILFIGRKMVVPHL